jgi:DNA-binding transcriptional LysR family regulator
MELRHLRYFVAVAEAGSLTLAAEKRLHTAQPSLSRQIRDLESEVGVQLMNRSVRGIELSPAGRAFLDHARLALAQVEAAKEAARRAAQPAKVDVGFRVCDWNRNRLATGNDTHPSRRTARYRVHSLGPVFPRPSRRLDEGQARRRVPAARRASRRSGLQACGYGAIHRRVADRPSPCLV